MGRHQENPFRHLFSYDKSSNKSVCNIEGCGGEVAGNHGGNLQRHIQHKHPAEYAAVSDSTGKRPASTADGQTTLDAVIVKKPKTTGLHIQLNPDVLKDACKELVTVNGRPFTLMEDTGFRKIIEPIQQAIGNDFVINSLNIRDMVSSVAHVGREKLKNELKGRLLMLKIDSATCRDRSVLGINVQYTDGEKMLRTLAIRVLTERHTAEYISSVVNDVLHEYNVELRQVYSVTSDNGANMLKALSLLSDMQEGTPSDEENETDPFGAEMDKDELDGIQCETPDLVIELDSMMSGHVLRSVRCSAHTLQLAVDDAFKRATVIQFDF